jgi:hypothetical protein
MSSSAIVVLLWVAVGTGLGWLGWPSVAGERDGLGQRLVLAFLAGLLLLHGVMAWLDLLAIEWRPVVILPLLALVVVVRMRSGSAPPLLSTPFARPGWGDLVGGLAILGFSLLALRLTVSTPDFVYHWGIKGHRFFLAGGVDYDFLRRPWNWHTHADYPHLLPELYAWTAHLLGRWREPAMQVYSGAFCAGLLIAGRETLRGARVSGFSLQATMAFLGLTCGMVGAGQLQGASADWLIALALLAAAPAFLDPQPGAPRAAQIGLLAAFAAAAKLEGAALAGFLIGGFCWRLFQVYGRVSPRFLASLLLPTLLLDGPWALQRWRHGLYDPAHAPRLDLDRTGVILEALWRSVWWPEWGGLPLLLLLLPWLVLPRRTRALGAVVCLQAAFYLFAYWSSAAGDVSLLVLTSASRLFLHLVPVLVVLAVVVLDGAPEALSSADLR